MGDAIDRQNKTVKILQKKPIPLKSLLQSIGIKKKPTLNARVDKSSKLLIAILAGKAFIMQFYDALCGLKTPHHIRRINVVLN